MGVKACRDQGLRVSGCLFRVVGAGGNPAVLGGNREAPGIVHWPQLTKQKPRAS